MRRIELTVGLVLIILGVFGAVHFLTVEPDRYYSQGLYVLYSLCGCAAAILGILTAVYGLVGRGKGVSGSPPEKDRRVERVKIGWMQIAMIVVGLAVFPVGGLVLFVAALGGFENMGMWLAAILAGIALGAIGGLLIVFGIFGYPISERARKV